MFVLLEQIMIRRNFKGNSALSIKSNPREIIRKRKSERIWEEYYEKKKIEFQKNKKNLDTPKTITKNIKKKKLSSRKQINQKIKSERINRLLKGTLKKSPIISTELRLIEIQEKLVEYGYEKGKITRKNTVYLFNAINDLRKLGITSLPKDLDEAKYWIVCKKLKNIGFPVIPNTTEEGEECIEYVMIHSQLKKLGYEGVPKSVEDAKSLLKKLELDAQSDSLKKIQRRQKNRKIKFSKTRPFTTF